MIFLKIFDISLMLNISPNIIYDVREEKLLHA
jgi:hypothetical protein